MSDFSNVDADLLVASYSDVDAGNVHTPHIAIAPGGSGSVTVNAVKMGLLEVMVATGHEEESGRLNVTRNGVTAHDEAIKGPISWLYTVIE
jgi:hypothetical protein